MRIPSGQVAADIEIRLSGSKENMHKIYALFRKSLRWRHADPRRKPVGTRAPGLLSFVFGPLAK